MARAYFHSSPQSGIQGNPIVLSSGSTDGSSYGGSLRIADGNLMLQGQEYSKLFHRYLRRYNKTAPAIEAYENLYRAKDRAASATKALDEAGPSSSKKLLRTLVDTANVAQQLLAKTIKVDAKVNKKGRNLSTLQANKSMAKAWRILVDTTSQRTTTKKAKSLKVGQEEVKIVCHT